MRIAHYTLASNAVLAPMAGVTDRPFRQLCRRFGAALAPAEMLHADQRLWCTEKSRRRMDHAGEPEPRVVQLAGADPEQLAEAARANVQLGAQIIDINMGCPAKKVFDRHCGSALLADEGLVERILATVVRAVTVPVTLKIRTGIGHSHRNAPRVAQIAQACGVAALAVHGRTRADLFRGDAEYDTIRDTRAAVAITLLANGDVGSPQKARAVLDFTGADGVMIGRAAQGAPWIFRDVNAYLITGHFASPLLRAAKTEIILQHLESLYEFYGEFTGVLMAAETSASQFAAASQGFGHWAKLAAA
jgi:tRNA-dihydrouridine synthase B